MKKPSIIVFPDHPTSACAFWRIAPYNELARQGHVNVSTGDYTNTWNTLRMFDIAIFQRPINKDCLHQILLAKDLGLKIIIDLDDLNFIPEFHPVYDHYMSVYDELAFTKMLMCADMVTVTTETLKQHYLKYSNNVQIIPNAYNDHWLRMAKQKKGKEIFIRGGTHHESDIYVWKNEISNVLKKNPEWRLVLSGSNPIFLQQEVPIYACTGDLVIHSYFAYILQAPQSIFIVPLIDNDFNRSKSNIAWIEATAAGSIALTPDYYGLENYSATYSDSKSFVKSLKECIGNEELRDDLYKKSIQHLKENYLLSKVNQQRLELIHKLINN